MHSATPKKRVHGGRSLSTELIARGEAPNSILVTDAVGMDTELHEDALRRALNYGRIPATSLTLAWCNLDISNMDICELVEMEKYSSAPGGSVDGVVHTLRNKKWNMEDTFGKRLYVFVKTSGGTLIRFVKASPPN